MVEAHVMRHQHGALQQAQQGAGDLVKTGGFSHHGVADAGQALDEGRNSAARVHQGAPACHLLPALHAHGGNLGDAVAHRVAAGGFQVKQQVTGQHRGRRRQAAANQVMSMAWMEKVPARRSAK